jgi:hypothetical protein
LLAATPTINSAAQLVRALPHNPMKSSSRKPEPGDDSTHISTPAHASRVIT